MDIKKSVEELMQEFGEVKPIFDHVGLLTYDREKAAEFLLSVPGSKVLVKKTVDFPQELVTVGSALKIDIYHIEVCGIDVEVIQPVDCPEAYVSKNLAVHGDSFHHLAVTFENSGQHKAMCRILEERGYQCVFEATPGNLLVHYYEHEDGSAIALELKSMRE